MFLYENHYADGQQHVTNRRPRGRLTAVSVSLTDGEVLYKHDSSTWLRWVELGPDDRDFFRRTFPEAPVGFGPGTDPADMRQEAAGRICDEEGLDWTDQGQGEARLRELMALVTVNEANATEAFEVLIRARMGQEPPCR